MYVWNFFKYMYMYMHKRMINNEHKNQLDYTLNQIERLPPYFYTCISLPPSLSLSLPPSPTHLESSFSKCKNTGVSLSCLDNKEQPRDTSMNTSAHA